MSPNAGTGANLRRHQTFAQPHRSGIVGIYLGDYKQYRFSVRWITL